jgi:hypothetical protein
VLSDLVLVAAVVGACVFVARGTRWAAAIECAFPLLAIVALCVTDKFFWFGVIVAAAFAAATLVAREMWVLVIAGVLLLRWIPLREVEVWREVVVLGGALALFAAIKPRSPLALIAVLAVAAVTPVHPGKAALIPLLLVGPSFILRLEEPQDLVPTGAALVGALCAIAALFARWSLVPILVTAAFVLLVPFLDKLKPLAYAAALALFAMWPWSGIVARALPVVARYEPPTGEVRVVGLALARGESATVGGLKPVLHLTVNASVANGAGLPAGRVIGFVEARPIRIGEVADFGFTRRPHFFAARNPLPGVSRGDIRGYGATAWLHGAGAFGVACSAPIRTLHFRAADDLPPDTRLQIESIELPPR